MSTTTHSTPSIARVTSRTPLLVAGGVAAAVILNVVVALAAPAVGVDPAFSPLAPAGVVAFTLGGALIATLGWWLVVRFVPQSRRTLTVLVPVLFALTAIPDVLVMTGGLPIPNGGPAEGLALLLMHVVVVGVMVPVLARVFPPRGPADRRAGRAAIGAADAG